ncbi:MAG: pilus assembly protein [Acidobacteria bacterium]|nr:pilus assembly protein [Acidobacteriota bacterium]
MRLWRLVAPTRKRMYSRQRGVTLVEQALILPVLLALMFGVIDMSRALYTYHYVSYIAREATRWASVRSGNLNGGPVDQTAVDTFVKNVNGMGLDQNQFTTSLDFLRPPNGTPLCPVAGSSPANEKPGCIVQVTVSYNFAFITPLIPVRTINMSSESQIIITQ